MPDSVNLLPPQKFPCDGLETASLRGYLLQGHRRFESLPDVLKPITDDVGGELLDGRDSKRFHEFAS